MNIRALRTLLQISSVGSFSKAAEQLNMTLSAVSMQMKGLEEELGAELFDRNHRPPRMTPLACALLDDAARMLEADGRIRHLCRQSAPLTGHFRLGFVHTASVRLLPGFLHRAAQTYPQARFLIETGISSDFETAIQVGTLDAAVVTHVGAGRPDLRGQILFSDPLMFAVSGKAGPADLAVIARALPFLQFQPASGIGRLIAEHGTMFSSADDPPRIVLDSVEAIMSCVNQGLGFTLLPRPDIERYADRHVAMFVPTDFAVNRHLTLVTRRDLSDVDRQALCALMAAPPDPARD